MKGTVRMGAELRGAPVKGEVSWKKWSPAVSRRCLRLTAGLVWSGTGLALCVAAAIWLSGMDWRRIVMGASAGLALGALIHRYGFSHLAKRNISRIAGGPDRVCLFAFQAWRSYALIAVMMFLGHLLRHSHIPKLILAVIYSAIGTGLALSSSHYYEKLL